MNDFNFDEDTELTQIEFAHLGGGEVAYVRELGEEQVIQVIENVPDLPENAKLYGLYAADGTCMVITDSKDAAHANALEQDLQPVSVH